MYSVEIHSAWRLRSHAVSWNTPHRIRRPFGENGPFPLKSDWNEVTWMKFEIWTISIRHRLEFEMAEWSEIDVKPSRIGKVRRQKILSKNQLQTDDFQTHQMQIRITRAWITWEMDPKLKSLCISSENKFGGSTNCKFREFSRFKFQRERESEFHNISSKNSTFSLKFQ